MHRNFAKNTQKGGQMRSILPQNKKNQEQNPQDFHKNKKKPRKIRRILRKNSKKRRKTRSVLIKFIKMRRHFYRFY
jgi:hypothetical protein